MTVSPTARPGLGPAGAPIEGLRSVLDVAPTVLGWLGFPQPSARPALCCAHLALQ